MYINKYDYVLHCKLYIIYYIVKYNIYIYIFIKQNGIIYDMICPKCICILYYQTYIYIYV